MLISPWCFPRETLFSLWMILSYTSQITFWPSLRNLCVSKRLSISFGYVISWKTIFIVVFHCFSYFFYINYADCPLFLISFIRDSALCHKPKICWLCFNFKHFQQCFLLCHTPLNIYIIFCLHLSYSICVYGLICSSRDPWGAAPGGVIWAIFL